MMTASPSDMTDEEAVLCTLAYLAKSHHKEHVIAARVLMDVMKLLITEKDAHQHTVEVVKRALDDPDEMLGLQALRDEIRRKYP
jgi:hypothetical protein